jgi:outer membrane receptor protein involved in Fe transport
MNQIVHSILKTGALRLLFVFLSATCYCQTDSVKLQDLSLRELLNTKVTTVSRTVQAIGLAPGAMLLVTKEQIRLRGYQSLLDVMYDLPDMKVDDKIYSGIRNSITVRGTQGSEKFVIMLDGIMISSPSGEALPIMENYPVNLAQQIEVVYGPASALYGANAVSGIINIITKKSSSKKGISIEGSSAGGSYRYINNSLLIAKKINDNLNLTVSGQYMYDKGTDYSKLYDNDSSLNIASYTTGIFNTIYGPVKPVRATRPTYEAPMQAYNIYAALLSDKFSFAFFKSFSKTPTAFGNNTSNAVYNKDVFMAQSVTTASSSYKIALKNVTSNTSLIASEYNLDPQSNYRNLYTSMEPAYKYSKCTMIKGEEQLDYKANNKLNITAGAGYESYNSIPQSTDLQSPVNTGDHVSGTYLGTQSYYRPNGLEAQFYVIRYHNVGTYLQAQYSPNNKIDITIGARYDVNSRYGSSFNPRMGVVYKASAKTIIKVLYGTAYLAPSPSDSYIQYGSFNTPDSGRTYHSYFLHLPNPGLKPIKSQNVELNIRQDITHNLILTFDAYYSRLLGLHEFSDDNASTKLYNNSFNGIPVDYIEVFTNNNRQKNWGGSVQVNWKYFNGKLKMNSYASLSYVNGVFEKGPDEKDEEIKDAEIDFIAPFMLRLGTDMKLGKFTCSPRLIITGKQNLSGFSDTTTNVIQRQTIPGYALLNISLQYIPGKRISFFSNITNALNQRYKSVGFNMDLQNTNTELFYGQKEDPIRITAGINFNF